MSNSDLEVKIKIGEIEFYAKGHSSDVEAQRQNFTNIILPAAVEAIKNARSSQVYIEEAPTPVLDTAKSHTVLNVQADESVISVNEFISGKRFKTQEDLAIGLIYYYEVYKKIADFSTEELKNYFKESKNSLPGNPSMIVNRLFSKTFIMNANDDKKRYCLTQTGIRFVEEYTPKETKEKKATTKPRKKQVKAESVYAHLSADDLNLNNYPEIKSFKDFKEKMMLILYIVKEEGHGEEFSTYDVQTIMTDILGYSASKGQVQGVFDRNATWFKTVPDPRNKKGVKHRLLNGAVEYAKNLIDNMTADGE